VTRGRKDTGVYHSNLRKVSRECQFENVVSAVGILRKVNFANAPAETELSPKLVVLTEVMLMLVGD
jgi:hypothetical protein